MVLYIMSTYIYYNQMTSPYLVMPLPFISSFSCNRAVEISVCNYNIILVISTLSRGKEATKIMP